MGCLSRFFTAGWLALVSIWSVAEDKVYQWTDADGQTHYGSELPEGVPGQEVDLNSQPVTVEPTDTIYMWKDNDGHVHYGDQPPPGRTAEKMEGESKFMSTIRATKVRPGEQQLLQKLDPKTSRGR